MTVETRAVIEARVRAAVAANPPITTIYDGNLKTQYTRPFDATELEQYVLDQVNFEIERQTTADIDLASKTLRTQIKAFRATINDDKTTIANAPVTTNTNIVAQFNALRDMMTHMQNGWLKLLDLLEQQVMQKDN